jgi:RNA polymerase sigma-70 factor (ECF subfamily)
MLPVQPELYKKFETLFRDNYSRLSDYAYSILKSKQDAEDAVQDVFIKIWQKKPELVENEGIKFYLFTATKNTCISFLRKQSSIPFSGGHEKELHQVPVQEATAGKPVDYAALVKEALALLPPQCQAIYKMSRLAKLTYSQIAAELNLSVKTIENQMGKAIRLMREYARKHNIPLSVFLLLLFQYFSATRGPG